MEALRVEFTSRAQAYLEEVEPDGNQLRLLHFLLLNEAGDEFVQLPLLRSALAMVLDSERSFEEEAMIYLGYEDSVDDQMNAFLALQDLLTFEEALTADEAINQLAQSMVVDPSIIYDYFPALADFGGDVVFVEGGHTRQAIFSVHGFLNGHERGFVYDVVKTFPIIQVEYDLPETD